MLKKKISIIFIIFIGLIFSISLSIFYINSYDAYQLDGITHIMLKEETFAHWYKGAVILKQIEDGSNFFFAGEEMFTKPLPQRLVAIYSYILNFDIIEDWSHSKIALGNKLLFLIIQSFVYYISVFLFYKKISSIFNNRTVFFVIFFLCFEPTIFQYHSSFWTESIYFSIQLLIFSLMIDSNQKSRNFILIGLLLGLLFIQRSAGIFYIIIVLGYYFLTIEKKKFKKLFLIFFPYLIICILLGIHNYKRAEVFYIMPLESKYSMYKYFAKDVLAESKKQTIDEINKSEIKKAINWINKELPQVKNIYNENIKSPIEIGYAIKNEKLRIKYYKYLNERSYKILINNPDIAFKKIIKGFIHFSVLNPFFVFYDYEYFKNYSSKEIGDFINSDEHKNAIPIRLVYSLFIYLILIIGLYFCFKKNPKLLFLCLSSILYYYLILGWYGKTRLFVPNLIYCSIFFSLGLDYLLKKLPNKI